MAERQEFLSIPSEHMVKLITSEELVVLSEAKVGIDYIDNCYISVTSY